MRGAARVSAGAAPTCDGRAVRRLQCAMSSFSLLVCSVVPIPNVPSSVDSAPHAVPAAITATPPSCLQLRRPRTCFLPVELGPPAPGLHHIIMDFLFGLLEPLPLTLLLGRLRSAGSSPALTDPFIGDSLITPLVIAPMAVATILASSAPCDRGYSCSSRPVGLARRSHVSATGGMAAREVPNSGYLDDGHAWPLSSASAQGDPLGWTDGPVAEAVTTGMENAFWGYAADGGGGGGGATGMETAFWGCVADAPPPPPWRPPALGGRGWPLCHPSGLLAFSPWRSFLSKWRGGKRRRRR